MPAWPVTALGCKGERAGGLPGAPQASGGPERAEGARRRLDRGARHERRGKAAPQRAPEASGKQSMSVLRVMGTETEYGISVTGQPGANAMVTSSQIVNAYQAATAARARRARWDFEDVHPLRDARGFDLTREAADSSQLTDEDLGLAHVILTNGGRV